MKQAFVLLFIVAGILSSCKKDKNNNPAQTTAQKIQHKWNFISSVDYNYVGASTTLDYIDTLAIGIPGEYIEFRTDNKAYAFVGGDYDTSFYNIINDSKMTIGMDTLFINLLTENDFILTFSERLNPPFYDNIVSLKR